MFLIFAILDGEPNREADIETEKKAKENELNRLNQGLGLIIVILHVVLGQHDRNAMKEEFTANFDSSLASISIHAVIQSDVARKYHSEDVMSDHLHLRFFEQEHSCCYEKASTQEKCNHVDMHALGFAIAHIFAVVERPD